MSALFGFAGPPSKTLSGFMSDILAHRGQHVALCETPWATLGIRYQGDPIAFSAEPRFTSTNQLGAAERVCVERDDERVAMVAGQILESAAPTRAAMRTPPWRGAWVGAECSRGPLGVRLRLLRDGAGSRAIYWAKLGKRLLFASEPKAIFRAPGFEPTLRVGALAQYLTFSFIPTHETMLEGVFALGSGEMMVVDASGNEKRSTWFEYERSEGAAVGGLVGVCDGVTAQRWPALLRKTMGKAVRERLERTSPLVFLSGGIDSSLVAAERV